MKNYNTRIAYALKIIEKKDNIIGNEVLDIVNTFRPKIRYFRDLNKKELDILRDAYNIKSLNKKNIYKLLNNLDGMYIRPTKTILINSKRKNKEIVNTIVHEISHYKENYLVKNKFEKGKILEDEVIAHQYLNLFNEKILDGNKLILNILKRYNIKF